MDHRLRPGVVSRLVFVAAAVCLLAAALAFAIPALTREHAPEAARGGPGTTNPPGGPAAGVPVDRALFQAGSCRLFAPTSGNRHQTVFLDAGHGGVDPGATGKTEAGRTVYEDDLALRVELDTLALLRSDGTRWSCRGPPTRSSAALGPKTSPAGSSLRKACTTTWR